LQPCNSNYKDLNFQKQFQMQNSNKSKDSDANGGQATEQ